MNQALLYALVLLGMACGGPSPKVTDNPEIAIIPTCGNTWYAHADAVTDRGILDGGVDDWTDLARPMETWFYTQKLGTVDVALKARIPTGRSIIEFKLGEVTHKVTLSNAEYAILPVGRFPITSAGYQRLEMRGIEKTGSEIAEIKSIRVSGLTQLEFVRDAFYWARRGPSVHLNYLLPEDAGETLYFYSEIQVPEGQDVLGSYFMAGGFAEGYFGIQVNGPDERRILFSVWSPFKTDDPTKVPPDQRIQLVNKGAGVITGKFGNEGSGGQSYRRYMWKSGVDYGFLVKAEPTADGQTDYTAWFFAPDVGHWTLMARFRRPKTQTHLKRLHSFLENFLTQTGNQSRMARYSNQWARDTRGQWRPLTRARFTGDATARKRARLDYDGGANGHSFYLKNGGFFSAETPLDAVFERQSNPKPPTIVFADLPGN
jgi:hypothetical protein